ncbi:MAG: hypothetical protein ACPHIB_02605 [Thalassobaculaceae bacterium]
MEDFNKAFDYIIVGAGSAGCTLANRLTEDVSRTVLLLEAGGKDSNPWIHIPVGFVKTLDMPGLNWRFETEPELIPKIGGYQSREDVFWAGRAQLMGWYMFGVSHSITILGRS